MSQAGLNNANNIPPPPGSVTDLQGNTGGVVSPDGSGVINVLGQTLYTTDGNPGTFTLNINPRVNAYPITPYVVGAVGKAGYQTIQSACDAANAAGGGIVYVQPGSYTENLLLYANIEIVGTPGNSDAGTAGNTVIITGVHTPPTTGSFTFANVRLGSATDIFNSASAGSAALVLENVFIQITNGFLFNLPNWTGTFVTYNLGEGSTNNGMVNNTGGSTCFFISATHGAGTGQTMVTTGPVIMEEVVLNCPWSANTGTTIACDYVIFNQTTTLNNNSTGTFNWCRWTTGATAAITMSSTAAINIYHSIVNSSNNPAIAGAGAGTITYGDIIFQSNTDFSGTLTTTAANWQPYATAGSSVSAVRGTAGFNTSQFTVSSGFVSLRNPLFTWIDQAASSTLTANTGYFVTAASTQTLPAAPSQGDTVKIVCDTASAVVVTANAGQTIRLSASASSAAGTFTNTARGDALELFYRAATTQWIALNAVGNWTVA